MNHTQSLFEILISWNFSRCETHHWSEATFRVQNHCQLCLRDRYIDRENAFVWKTIAFPTWKSFWSADQKPERLYSFLAFLNQPFDPCGITRLWLAWQSALNFVILLVTNSIISFSDYDYYYFFFFLGARITQVHKGSAKLHFSVGRHEIRIIATRKTWKQTRTTAQRTFGKFQCNEFHVVSAGTPWWSG
jgi:hypothetical protein